MLSVCVHEMFRRSFGVLMYLGEEGGPDGLELRNLGGSDESLELVGLQWYPLLDPSLLIECARISQALSYSDLNTVIREDEGGVGGGELGGRHV